MSSPTLTPGAGEVLLRVRGLQKRYARREGWRTREVVALHDVDLDVRRGSVLAIFGESGCGKTTMARCIAGMEKPDGGSIVFGQEDRAALSARQLQRLQADVQLIFQDPSTALNPRFTAEELIAEPLLIGGRGTRQSNAAAVTTLMTEVGLSPDWRHRRPSQFSGGQLQRIAIARALAVAPRLLILDEAFAGLDLSTAAQIANLLLDLRSSHDLTYILISHDIGLAARLADEIVVMEAGTIVERGPARNVLSSPQQEATLSLIHAAGAMDNVFRLAAGDSA